MPVTNIMLSGEDWQFKEFIGEDWLLRNAQLPASRDTRGWMKAVVPGSVQNDLWQAGEAPDPYLECNSKAIEWTADRTWLYKKTFRVDPSLRGQSIQLVFEGVDYSARFYLNGDLLGQNTSMFLPAVFEVNDRLDYENENLLVVVIDPAPFEQPQIGYTSRVYTQKARMNYWWDFCPRAIGQGIWQEVFLRVTGPVRIEDLTVRADLSVDLLRAQVNVAIRLEKPDGVRAEVEISLQRESDGSVLQEDVIFFEPGESEKESNFRVDQPDLWWPNGAGDHPLYQVDVRVRVDDSPSDQKEAAFGVRRIEFAANDGAAEGALPYKLVVNNRPIYIQGWNWVPMDVLYGVEQAGKRERLLTLAKNAHVNLLRVWGGGLIEKEAFYDLCDRFGILVWQEFIQSSSGIDNFPSTDPQFIQFLVKNAEQAVRARRNHPALAVWCGGNELHYQADRLCDDSHPALAALKEAVERLDPRRHWVSTSPAGGVFSFDIPQSQEAADRMQDVHGPWEYQGLRRQYELYNQGQSLLHSEFGAEGLTNLRTLNRTIRPEHQWPVSLENPVWHHLGAWWVKEKVWADVFGSFSDIKTAQRATQFLQADGLRYAVEADRRRMFRNSGTMPWQFNEPYPMAACTSAVDYYAEPKPVYYAVSRAYQSISFTAKFDTLAWAGEDSFRAEIWCANSGSEQSGSLTIGVVGMDGQVFDQVETQVKCSSNQAQAVAQLNTPLESVVGDLFFLDIRFKGSSDGFTAGSRYLFSKGQNLSAMVQELPQAAIQTKLEKQAEEWLLTLENQSNTAALWIWLEAEKQDLRAFDYAYFEDNYFCLLPNERRQIHVQWVGLNRADQKVLISGWNFTEQTLG